MNTNTKTVINNFIEALGERASQHGDGRLDYALGFLYSTLTSLHLDTYVLESLERDTKCLTVLANENQEK